MSCRLDLSREEIDTLDDVDLSVYAARSKWLAEARPEQLLPPGDDYDTVLWRAGRFFGKTRTLVENSWFDAYRVPIRIHALAPTLGDVRRVLFEGESGYINKMPPEIVRRHDKTNREIELTNGSLITGFSVVEEANRLRGPQCHLLVFDEAAAADRPAGNLEEAYNVAVLGCRLPYPDGTPSRKLIATTPRPIPFLKRLEKRPNVRVITGTSYANLHNVAASVRNELLALSGTLIGKQEIDGRYIDEEDDQTIFRRAWFRLWPANKKLPEFSFILELYDTAFSEENYDAKRNLTDPTAKTVWGIFNVKQCFNEEERKRLKIRSQYAALLLDAWAERLGFPELLDRARRENWTKYGSPGRRSDIVLIEEKGSGISLRQTLATYSVLTWPYNPGRQSKTQRAHAVSPVVNQGMVFVPESKREDRKGLPRDWCEPFLEQVCAYRGKGSVEHDDYLDTMTSALLYLRDRNMLSPTPEITYIDLEDKRQHDERDAEKQQRANEPRDNPYG